MTDKEIDSQKISEMKRTHTAIEGSVKERQRLAVLSVKRRLEIHVNMLEIGIDWTQKIDAIINQGRIDQVMVV